MRRTLLKSKIHRAVVTASDLVPFEKVHVDNVSNGARFSTYILKELDSHNRIKG